MALLLKQRDGQAIDAALRKQHQCALLLLTHTRSHAIDSWQCAAGSKTASGRCDFKELTICDSLTPDSSEGYKQQSTHSSVGICTKD